MVWTVRNAYPLPRGHWRQWYRDQLGAAVPVRRLPLSDPTFGRCTFARVLAPAETAFAMAGHRYGACVGDSCSAGQTGRDRMVLCFAFIRTGFLVCFPAYHPWQSNESRTL